MRLPRDLDARELIKLLERLGYRVERQTGSHVRLRTDHPSPHSITIPNHSPLKVGTLAAILADVAGQRGIDRAELIALLSQDR
jgi:predicted RNA binding protein YcfA (HicA-like mRNA interferase family)